MSERLWTEGPWKYVELSGIDSRGMGYVRPSDEDSMEISHSGDMDRSEAENRANGLLQSAAPDLYSAVLDLQGLIQLMQNRPDFPKELKDSIPTLWRWKNATAALAKARGERA